MNAQAFAPKVVENVNQSHATDAVSSPTTKLKTGRCACVLSQCLNHQCRCYKASIGCSSECKCIDCENSYGRRRVHFTNATNAILSPTAYVGPIRRCFCIKSQCSSIHCPCYQISVGCCAACRCKDCKNKYVKERDRAKDTCFTDDVHGFCIPWSPTAVHDFSSPMSPTPPSQHFSYQQTDTPSNLFPGRYVAPGSGNELSPWMNNSTSPRYPCSMFGHAGEAINAPRFPYDSTGTGHGLGSPQQLASHSQGYHPMTAASPETSWLRNALGPKLPFVVSDPLTDDSFWHGSPSSPQLPFVVSDPLTDDSLWHGSPVTPNLQQHGTALGRGISSGMHQNEALNQLPGVFMGRSTVSSASMRPVTLTHDGTHQFGFTSRGSLRSGMQVDPQLVHFPFPDVAPYLNPEQLTGEQRRKYAAAYWQGKKIMASIF